MFPVESSHLLDNPLTIWPITAYFFFYFKCYVEPWQRGTFFKRPLSGKGLEAAKCGPLNRGSVAGEFTDNFVHPCNQPLNKGGLGGMAWGWGKT